MKSILCWTVLLAGACWGVWLMYPVILHQREFTFPSRYQFQITSWFGVGLDAHFPSQYRDFVWFEPVQALFVLPQSMSSYV